jgi:hypothetical protein
MMRAEPLEKISPATVEGDNKRNAQCQPPA